MPDSTPAIESTEIREMLLLLLDTLSAVRLLSELEVRERDESWLLTESLRILMQHHEVDSGAIFLWHDGELACAASLRLDQLRQDGALDPIPPRPCAGQGVVRLTAESGRIQSFGDCARDSRFLAAVDREGPFAGCLLGVPITDGGVQLGVLTVHHPEPYAFESWHHHVMTIYCNILGSRIANGRAAVRLEEIVEQRTRELEAALAEAEQLKLRYQMLSTVDELTGLHNRRFFLSEAERGLGQATRHRQPFSLMIVDLDFFKQINDTFGHAVGDIALKDVAEVLGTHTREGDILARFGGEEFVLALPSTELAGALVLARRIQDHVRSLRWRAGEETFQLTVSVGVACAGPGLGCTQHLSLDELLRQADTALYYCKNQGRDLVRAYTDLPEVAHAASAG